MELDKIEKITLKDFGQRLAALLHTKNGGYNSITELIDDFWLFLILKINFNHYSPFYST